MHEQGGYTATQELLALETPPTALFTDNDLTTVGALRAAHDRGVRIPTDLSIIGFGDFPMADLLTPPLTVVAQPTYQMAARAAELLLSRIGAPKAPVREVVLIPTLVVGASTAVPAMAVAT
jgi:LacI family transcriptional regulator